MEILLTITGLFIAIIALPWFRRPIERIYQKIKQRVLIGRAPQGTLPFLNLVALALTFHLHKPRHLLAGLSLYLTPFSERGCLYV